MHAPPVFIQAKQQAVGEEKNIVLQGIEPGRSSPTPTELSKRVPLNMSDIALFKDAGEETMSRGKTGYLCHFLKSTVLSIWERCGQGQPKL
jgi:hypothetical protein